MSAELEDDFGEINYLTDSDRGSNILPEFLKNSPDAKGLVDVVIPEIQELHDSQSDIYSTINILEAVGTQLDDIFGELLDTPRVGSQSDADYRQVLLAVAPSIAGSGTIQVIKTTLRSLSGSSDVSLIEVPPHTILLHVFVDAFGDITDKELIDTSMNKIKGGGITMEIGIQLNSSAFVFSENVAGGAAGEGFATLIDGSDGGVFASLEVI